MEIDDYESLPTTSLAINMYAGGMAGILEHCIMYPLDSVKTRMQSLLPGASRYNLLSTLQNMTKTEGLLRPIRGVSVVVAGAGPAHALYFGSYELTKEMMTKFTSHNNVNYMLSAVCATVIHDAVSNPTEVIKQRMQMYNSRYRSVIACMKGVYQTEGFRAFYRSYYTQLVMNIPYQTIHFATYEFFQNMLNHDRGYNPKVHVVAGGAAGACAAAITTPLDVVKTLLNTQETGFTKGMMEAIRQIYTVAGPGGFFKGLTARVLYAMPATAICWSTYEFFKFYFCGMDRSQYKSSISGKSMLQPRDSTKLTTMPRIANADGFSPDSEHSDGSAYVVPVAPVPAPSENQTSTQVKETSHPHQPNTPPAPPAPITAGSIKTVCDLSTSVATPTLNLHTRHTDVKSPFDRRFSSS